MTDLTDPWASEDPWANPEPVPQVEGQETLEEAGILIDPGPVVEGWVVPANIPQVPITSAVARLSSITGEVVDRFRDPDEVAAMSGALGRTLADEVRGLAVEARAARPEGPVTDVVLAPELRVLADARDTLAALAKAFTTGANEARDAAGEVLVELAGDPRRTVTVKVPDGHGWLLTASRRQPTETQANLGEVIDLLVADLPAQYEGNVAEARAYASGIRQGIQELLRLVSPVKWKSTALDEWKQRLEAAEKHDLAIRLGHAYGRPSKGKPSITFERSETGAGE